MKWPLDNYSNLAWPCRGGWAPCHLKGKQKKNLFSTAINLVLLVLFIPLQKKVSQKAAYTCFLQFFLLTPSWTLCSQDSLQDPSDCHSIKSYLRIYLWAALNTPWFLHQPCMLFTDFQAATSWPYCTSLVPSQPSLLAAPHFLHPLSAAFPFSLEPFFSLVFQFPLYARPLPRPLPWKSKLLTSCSTSQLKYLMSVWDFNISATKFP